ncbi:exosortase-associated protein EpsI, B-type [Massilia aurea]|uniref:exosortase-associated protein EpsI, B-type n=1 Tax=Massilia aurea TaxID=373040 RepID=UPI00346274D8
MIAAQRRALVVSIVPGVAMALTAILTSAVTPTPRAPLPHEQFSLAQMIPARFDAWAVDPGVAPVQPDPAQQGMLEKIYDQTLSRTYVGAHGQRVMLSIAYGGDQSKSLQLHLPEICYVAQGFQLVTEGNDVLATRYGALPVKRLVARLQERNEPITYWITIGDKASKAGIEHKLRRLAYGLSGEVPDGMLVRVSTIASDERHAYAVQDRFIAALLAALAPAERAHLIGHDSAPAALASASPVIRRSRPGAQPTQTSTTSGADLRPDRPRPATR